MSFAGLTLAQLLLPLGAAAGGVTVLYLLKMRRRQVEVPFAALWAQVLRQSETRKLWRRLRRILSWLMQLVLLGLIALALSDPRPESWLRDARTVAVVIDTSASMGGRDRDGPTRLEQAVTRARGELEALGPNDRALLLFAGAEVVVGAPLGAGPAAMNAALDKVTLSPGEADIRAAMSLARNALAGRAGPEVLLLTDAALPESQRKYLDACRGDDPKQACRIGLSTSEPANLAITAFAARRYPGDREKVEVLAQVHNLGLRPARALLRIEADGVITGYTAVVAPDAIERGFNVWVTARLAAGDPTHQTAFEEGMRAIAAVTEAHHVTGDVDYLIRVEVKDLAAYDHVIRNDLARLPGNAHITSYVVTSTVLDPR